MSKANAEFERLLSVGDEAAMALRLGGGVVLPKCILPCSELWQRRVMRLGEPPVEVDVECIKVTDLATWWRIVRDMPADNEEAHVHIS